MMINVSHIPEFDRLQIVCPEILEALLDSVALVESLGVDERLLEPARRRFAFLLGRTALDDLAEGPVEQAAAKLTDQFILGIAGVTDDHRQPLRDAFAEEEMDKFCKALYVLDMSYRIRLIMRGLFTYDEGPILPLPPHMPRSGKDINFTLRQFARLVGPLADAEVGDPQAIEFMRLRAAWYHNSPRSLAGRLAIDGRILVDRADFENIKDYESSDLPERRKSLLRLVDAYTMDPHEKLDDDLRARLFAFYTPEQIIALLFRVAWYTAHKMVIVMGADNLPYDGPSPILAYTPEGHRITDYWSYAQFLAVTNSVKWKKNSQATK